MDVRNLDDDSVFHESDPIRPPRRIEDPPPDAIELPPLPQPLPDMIELGEPGPARSMKLGLPWSDGLGGRPVMFEHPYGYIADYAKTDVEFTQRIFAAFPVEEEKPHLVQRAFTALLSWAVLTAIVLAVFGILWVILL